MKDISNIITEKTEEFSKFITTKTKEFEDKLELYKKEYERVRLDYNLNDDRINTDNKDTIKNIESEIEEIIDSVMNETKDVVEEILRNKNSTATTATNIINENTKQDEINVQTQEGIKLAAKEREKVTYFRLWKERIFMYVFSLLCFFMLYITQKHRSVYKNEEKAFLSSIPSQ